MAAPKTMFDKIWERHVVESSEDGDSLLYVDRCLIHEGSNHAFDKIQAGGRGVARPSQVFAFSDHYVPTTNRHLGIAGVNDPAIRGMIEQLAENSRAHGIRLFGIDTPEWDQPHGSAAREALARLVDGRNVAVVTVETDDYGRTVGTVYLGDTNINLAMIEAGHAWWYRRYAPYERYLAAAEERARRQGRGLWSGADPVPPWNWRRSRR